MDGQQHRPVPIGRLGSIPHTHATRPEGLLILSSRIDPERIALPFPGFIGREQGLGFVNLLHHSSFTWTGKTLPEWLIGMEGWRSC